MNMMKRSIVWAAFVLLLTAIPVTGLSARGLFPVSSLRTAMISDGGPVSAWRCGAWAGMNWTPDYFSAEWAAWECPGMEAGLYMNWMLRGSCLNWYGCYGLRGSNLYYNTDHYWTGWYSIYRGYLPDPWMYRYISRHGRSHAHPGPKPVIKAESPRRNGASKGGVVHRRRPPVKDAPPARVPRGRPHVTPRPRPTPMPPRISSPSPVIRSTGYGGKHRR